MTQIRNSKRTVWIVGTLGFVICLGFRISCLGFNLPSAFADDAQNVNYVERGFYRIFTGPFELPRQLLQRTFSGPPIVGTVDGALTGTVAALSSVMGGLFDVVRGTIPYAKYGPLFFL